MKDGNVTTTIKNFDPAIGMLPDKHYEIVVNVDFTSEAESEGRYVDINLGEGMTYRNFQVLNPDKSDPQEQELSFINKGVVADTTKPEKTSYSLLGFRIKSGLLSYKLNASRTTGFQISFDATADPFIVHKPINIADAIKVSAGVKEKIIGTVATDILTQPTSPFISYMYVGATSQNMLLGTNKVGFARYYHVFNNGTNRPGYFKSAKVTFSPSSGLTADRFIDYPENCKIEGDKLVCNYENYFNTGEYTPISFSLDTDGLPAGNYIFSGPVFEGIDIFGRKIEQSYKYIQSSINVIDPATVDNKLNISAKARPGFSEYSGNTMHEYTQPDFLVSMNSGVIGAKNQTIEMTWSSYETSFVSVPNNLNKVTEIQYRTNQNTEIRTASGSQLDISSTRTIMTSESVGLEDGEYFTFIKAKLGDFDANYSSSTQKDSIGYFGSRYLDSRGKPVKGSSQISQELKTYSEESGVIDPKSVSTQILTANKYASKSVWSVVDYNPNISVKAGDSIKSFYSLSPAAHFYSNETQFGISNPVLYFKNVPGVTFSNFSIANGTPGFTINSVSLVKGQDGNDYTRVDISGDVGQYYDSKRIPMTLNYTVNTQKFAKGVYKLNDLILLEMDSNAEARIDVKYTKNDILNNKNYYRGNSINTLNITPSAELYVNSFIRREDGNIQPPYDEEKPTTAVGLVPNSQVKYTVEIMNSMTTPVNAVETFIPVPKEGNNFGEKIQNKPFYWNMKLLGVPAVQVVDKDGNIITDQRKMPT